MARNYLRRIVAVALNVTLSFTALQIINAPAASADPTCPCTLFSTTTPTTASFNDGDAVELGVTFSSSEDGYISGIRFYKGTTNTGTHYGHLWNDSGELLATTTFTSETSSGWQVANFGRAVEIEDGETYVASYWAPEGNYAYDANFFSSPHVSDPLTATGAVFRSGEAPDFPQDTTSANYWVDVVFSTGSAPADSTAPTVTNVSPADEGTDVSVSSPVVLSFSESLDPESVSFESVSVTPDGSDKSVIADVAYDPLTNWVTIDPLGTFRSETPYDIAVTTDIEDLAGNNLAVAYESNFLTEELDFDEPNSAHRVFADSETPETANSSDDDGVTLGTKFIAAVSGTVTGVAFYKGTSNTGTHTGALYASNGDVLASGTFSGETSTGWQTLVFSQPVLLNAGEIYTAAYFAPNGHYSHNAGYFEEDFVSGLLRVPAEGGVFIYGSTMDFPQESHEAGAYWVTPIFEVQADEQRLFADDLVPEVASAGDTDSVNLGTKFVPLVDGEVTGVSFYKGTGNGGTHTGSLWSKTGTSLATGTFSGETSSGWQNLTFTNPVEVEANETYVVSYLAPQGHYSYTSSFFDGYNHVYASLSAPSSELLGGNGVYNYSSSTAFPSNSFNATNYFVSPVFEPAAQNAPPLVAAFTATPTTGVDPFEVDFDASTSTTTTPAIITNYAWDFGDGFTANGQTASHTYGPGTYTARLTVTDSASRTAFVEETITVGNSTYSDVVQASDPVRYYRLGETSGTTAADSSSSGVNGTYGANVTVGAGDALAQDANTAISTSAASVDNLSASATGLPSGSAARTLEAWFKTVGDAGSSVINYGNFRIDVYSSNAIALNYANSIDIAVNPGYTVTDDNWHYVVGTYDGTTARLYLDGALIGTQAMSVNSSLTTPLYSDIHGSLDEVAVYDSALSAQQISTHWTKGNKGGDVCVDASTSTYGTAVMSDGPSRYYKLDDGSGSRVVLDASGNCLNGGRGVSITAGASGALAGDSATALSTSSTNTNFSASATGLPSGSAARTLEAWFKTAGDAGSSVVNYGNLRVDIYNANALALNYADSIDIAVNPGYTVTDGNWHHVVGTYDGTTARLYLDGVLLGTQAMSINSSLSTPLYSDLNGSLDEVAVYPRALSSAEISEHWTKGNKIGNACAAVPTSSYGSAVVADGADRYFRFDEDTSTRVVLDSSGNCLNGSRSATTTAGVSGALAGDGSTALATTSVNDTNVSTSGDDLPSGGAARSLEAWFKTTSSSGISAVSYGGLRIDIYDANTIALNINGADDVAVNVGYPITDGEWHHVVGTYDGTLGRVYLDGALQAADSLAINTSANTRLISDLVGAIDEIAIYSTALTADQVSSHWTKGGKEGAACAGVPTSSYSAIVRADSPSRYYKLDDASGSRVLLDSSGNCQNGSRAPSTVAGSAGALVGDGTTGLGTTANEHNISASASSLPSGAAPRTIEAWFKTTSESGMAIVAYGGLRIDLYSSIAVALNYNGSVDAAAELSHSVTDGQWHHAAGTYDGTTGRLYVDGNLVASRTMTLSTPSNSELLSDMNGVLDEVAVYPTALPDSHIYLHYIAGKYAGLVGDGIDIRELLASGNSCYGCLAQTIMGAAHGLHADPIDTTFGTFSQTIGDLAVDGRGLPLVQMRSYSSAMASDNGPFGYGWKGGYNAKLTVDSGTGDVTISQENGAEVTFVEGAGVYTPAAQRFIATLVHNGDGTWTFKRNNIETLVFNSSGQLSSHADRNGIATTLTYSSGKLAAVTNAEGRSFTYTWTGDHITKITDSASREVNYTYDSNGDLITVVGADGATWHYTYDANHRLLTQLDPNQGGSLTPHPVTNVYDTLGRVISQTDQLDRETTFVYNTDGSVLVTDPEGHQSLDIYQNHLRVAVVNGYGTPQATTTHFGYDPRTASLVASFVEAPNDPNDHATFATYDEDGNMLTSTDGEGRVSTYTYDAFGNVLTATTPNPSTTGPAAVTTTNTYDGNGNLLTTTSPLYTGTSTFTSQTITYGRSVSGKPDLVSSITDPLSKVTTMAYDSIGQLTSTTSPEGRVTSYTYDSLGRTLTVVAPKGNESGATSADFTTTYSYDEVGRVLGTSTANDGTPIVTTNVYDDNGNLISTTDGDNRTTTYVYDLANQQTEVHRPDSTVLETTYYDNGVIHQQIDGDGKATTYGQDALGRIISTEDPNNRITTFTYDGAGNVLTTTDPSNRVTTNAYDDTGALVSTNYSDAGTPDVTITYGNAGQRTQMTDGSGTQTWEYDSLGRITSHTNGNSKEVGYTYNIRGEATGIDYPDHGDVTRTYDDDGLLETVEDFDGNETSFAYDRNGQLTQTEYANGVVGTNTYDDPGRLSNIAYTNGSTNLATFAYGRTTGGDVTSETNSGTSAGANKTYTYNTLGQLATENSGTFDYDDADNLTSLNGVTQTYDDANQLLTSGTKTFGYDSQGNRTTQTQSSTTTTLAHDQANRLKSYGINTYAYDGGGLRTAKTVGSTTSNFVYDTVQGLPLVIDDGMHAFVYGPGGMVISQVDDSDETTYVHQDQLGSTRLLTDDDGNAAGTYQFDAYGNTTAHAGVNTTMQYAGQYKDDESGLYWMRARYYDPNTAQFVSRDPIVAITRSAYGYVDGDPVNSTDVTGLLCVTFLDKNCKSFAATHAKQSQAVADFAGGVLDGATAGHADWLLAESAEDNYNKKSKAHSAGDLASWAIPVPPIAKGIKAGKGAWAVFRNPLRGTCYTQKVVDQMANVKDVRHAFPSTIDSLARRSDTSKKVGRDGIERTWVEMRGSINKEKGVFEWIIEKDKTINHRFFRRD